jgi:hypothetical protein
LKNEYEKISSYAVNGLIPANRKIKLNSTSATRIARMEIEAARQPESDTLF